MFDKRGSMITIDKTLTQLPFYKRRDAMRLYIHFLINSTNAEYKTTFEDLQEQLGISKPDVTRALMEMSGAINRGVGQDGIDITINNFHQYTKSKISEEVESKLEIERQKEESEFLQEQIARIPSKIYIG